jgi:hypothetical protein
MFTLCAGKQIDVTQILTNVKVMHATGKFMDAGWGEWKAITRANLTLMRNILTHTQKLQQSTKIGMAGAKIVKPGI